MFKIELKLTDLYLKSNQKKIIIIKIKKNNLTMFLKSFVYKFEKTGSNYTSAFLKNLSLLQSHFRKQKLFNYVKKPSKYQILIISKINTCSIHITFTQFIFDISMITLHNFCWILNWLNVSLLVERIMMIVLCRKGSWHFQFGIMQNFMTW